MASCLTALRGLGPSLETLSAAPRYATVCWTNPARAHMLSEAHDTAGSSARSGARSSAAWYDVLASPRASHPGVAACARGITPARVPRQAHGSGHGPEGCRTATPDTEGGRSMARRGTRTRWDAGVVLLLVSTWFLGWPWPARARSGPPTAETSQQVVERMIRLMHQAEAAQAADQEAEAMPLIEQAVALGEQELGPDTMALVIPLERLSALYRTQ